MKKILMKQSCIHTHTCLEQNLSCFPLQNRYGHGCTGHTYSAGPELLQVWCTAAYMIMYNHWTTDSLFLMQW